MANQDFKTPVKEMKTKDARKKMKNRNGKIGINKNNNFAYIADAPRKQCQKCGSVNHLTHLCKKGKKKKVMDHRQRMLKTYDSEFADKGFKVLFNKEECTFISKKTGEVALKGARKGNLFVADLDSANEDGICYVYTMASVEQSNLWHKKLSHLNFKAINTLVKKELVRDMPNLEFAEDEAEDQNCVKRLRSDNEKEFRNATLTEFCKDRGIVQEFLAARTPQQNGVVERKNRTLVEAARTMLQDAKLSTSFWEEAMNTTCYT
ncbi:hypothetical protein AgCh_018533 [Apium graveolens]